MELSFYQKRRKELKLTYDQLVVLTGLSKRTIAGFFGGDETYQNLSIRSIELIEKALGISSDPSYYADHGVTNLTEDEAHLLDLFRSMNEKNKNIYIGLGETLSEK